MTDSNLTAIQLIIDRSGSMNTIKKDAQGAINTFIEDQKKQPGRCLLRLTDFDYEANVVYPLGDIANAPSYVLHPRSMTALYDAVGSSIVELGEELAKMDEKDRPAHVLFVIVTDGEENSSQEYRDSSVIKTMIEKQQNDYSWEFVYLAANQDALLTGGAMGIRPNSSMTYAHTGGGTKSAMASASYYASGLRSGVTGQSFSDEDRKSAKDG